MTAYKAAQVEFRPLGLNTALANALARAGICTVRDLGTVTREELDRVPGIGARTVSHLTPYLRRPDSAVGSIHRRSRTVSAIFDPEMLTAIDAWAAERGGLPMAEAIRRLVEQGLAAQPNAPKLKA